MQPRNVQRVSAFEIPFIKSYPRIPSRKRPNSIFSCVSSLYQRPRSSETRRYLLCLEEQDGAVAEVEVYEVLGFCQRPELALRLLRKNVAPISPRDRCQGPGKHTVGDEASKIAADNTVPCRTLPLVERLLNVLRNILPSVTVS